MHYDLKCAECDRKRSDVFWPTYEAWEHVFELDKPCRCGCSEFVKAGVPLTANMRDQWYNTCQRIHGRKDMGMPKPDPDLRRRQADAMSE